MRWICALISILAFPLESASAGCVNPNGAHADYQQVKILVTNDVKTMVAGGENTIKAGFEQWNSAPCVSTGAPHPFPWFSSSSSSLTITVKRIAGTSAGGNTCARMVHNTNEIQLFTQVRHPVNLSAVYACDWSKPDKVSDVIAHELGHFLGLGEPTPGANCPGYIMGPATYLFENGVAWDASFSKQIQMDECNTADVVSATPEEQWWETQVCQNDPSCDPYAPCTSQPICTCPILIDMNRDRFHLSGLEEAVPFDIDADGEIETITWTGSDRGDVFLCRDLNGNGLIDDGTELFGNSTQLGTGGGVAPFGYIALAHLDGPLAGGNADGLISSEDAVFEELCIWSDLNRNGFSEEGELRGLAESGLLAIEVDFVTNPRYDQHGNLFLYSGKAWIEDERGIRAVATTDVFFVER